MVDLIRADADLKIRCILSRQVNNDEKVDDILDLIEDAFNEGWSAGKDAGRGEGWTMLENRLGNCR